MTWIFLSPHLDDAALSCGGMIADMVQQGQSIEVWTICAGDPPPGPLSPFASSLHERWGVKNSPTALRREEDLRSCAILGAGIRHLDIPDCIYRRNPNTGKPLIQGNNDLFQSLQETEEPLAEDLQQQLARLLPSDARVVCPLTMGGHVDHHLVRRAAEALHQPLWYYADYPYAAYPETDYAKWIQPNWVTSSKPVSKAALLKWQDAIAEHKSQISTFWGSRAEMEISITAYWQKGGGSRLWRNG